MPISVDMGPAYLDWAGRAIGQRGEYINGRSGPLAPVPAVCHSVGNPHAVLFVDDAEAIDLDNVRRWSITRYSRSGLNISFAHQIGPNKFRMRVWERVSALPLPVVAGLVQLGLRFTGLDADRETLKYYGWRIGFIDWQDDGTVEGE